MNGIADKSVESFERNLEEFLSATSLTRQDKASRLLSQIDQLLHNIEGFHYLYEKTPLLIQNGIFDGTPWAEADKLVPHLVKGTLRAGHPSSSFEVISELRLLAIAENRLTDSALDAESASEFLEEVVVHNLEFAFNELTEVSRETMSEKEVKKAHLLIGYLMERMPLENVKNKLVEEVELSCAQRPVLTKKTRELIGFLHKKFDVPDQLFSDDPISLYVNAVYHPSTGSVAHTAIDDYSNFLETADEPALRKEAEEMGYHMLKTGLVSHHHALLLVKLVIEYPELVPICLALSETGVAEWNTYRKLISDIMLENVTAENFQCLYGFHRMLERSLFSRRPIRIGIENLRKIQINPQVEKRILKIQGNKITETTALQYLIGGIVKVLGQPLGVRQGNNPTCQSARGISIWSQHAPTKLIDIVIRVATRNNLEVRFENTEINSNLLKKGLMDKLDYNLDVVSVVLVPHLDKIYNEMMTKAMGRGDDPHKWVNPAMYGQWIRVGFKSAYDYLTNSINNFELFIRTFYVAFHPHYNGNRRMIYPNPVGIIITNSKAEMVGFHAVSLLRIKEDPSGVVRAYFLNPNNEGRQNWGQGIRPTVSKNGERPGESSLPINQFASRLYAFHYNTQEIPTRLEGVKTEDIEGVIQLTKESWGKSYNWI